MNINLLNKTIKKSCVDLEKMFTKGINKMKRENKKLPRRESLNLYRQILKFSNEFNWKDLEGINWRDKIRKSAREEFEIAKDE